ncbi:MAG: GNAT family N-acetyltransferase [Aestuariivirga sp.]
MTALPLGYSDLPAGKLANVVTCLEMRAKPVLRPVPANGLSLSPLDRRDLAGYRALYRAVGQDWMWFSRLVMADENLKGILADPAREPFVLMKEGERAGILELDFASTPGECEIAFFGVTPQAIGFGAGRYLMNEAIMRAWSKPISRLWVHTCTHDHPGALAFYIRSGFTPYQRLVEIHDDPRLQGYLPETASPHIPLIRPT